MKIRGHSINHGWIIGAQKALDDLQCSNEVDTSQKHPWLIKLNAISRDFLKALKRKNLYPELIVIFLSC